MAVNCAVNPKVIEGLAGVTITPVRTGADTVSEVLPTTEPEVALMVVPPWLMPVAFPPGLIVATVVIVEAHTTELVKFAVLLSV